jgi:hypothetical protein
VSEELVLMPHQGFEAQIVWRDFVHQDMTDQRSSKDRVIIGEWRG